jgi:ferredoxin-type protein NapG
MQEDRIRKDTNEASSAVLECEGGAVSDCFKDGETSSIESEIAPSTKFKAPAITRRSLCVGVGSIAALMALGCTKFVNSDALVRPPGGQDENRLLERCIRCEKCIEVCPRGAIKLTHIEDGLLTMRMPQMNFYSDYCDFCVEENDGVPLCASTCPTAALVESEAINAEVNGLGHAGINTDWCLAYHDTGCHICYDSCPYGAIELDDQRRPYVVADRCNGCGACEAACVSLTAGSRAIATDATTRAIVVAAK